MNDFSFCFFDVGLTLFGGGDISQLCTGIVLIDCTIRYTEQESKKEVYPGDEPK